MTDNKGSIVHKFADAGLKLGSNQAAVQALAFLRNVILARLLTAADFGIASIFAMTYALLEMVSNLAAETLLVQAPDGDDPPFQATAQLIQAVRGTINAGVLLLLSKPIALLFGVPQARWAFACLALFPLLKGFAHLDTSRLQRYMKFEPSILVNLVPAVLVTLLAYPLGRWLKDYRAMLWIVVLQVAAMVVVSHFVAQRRYAWTWNPEYAKRVFKFGWPLLINGVLMYLIFQGDRFVIGTAHQLFPRSNFTLTDLGVYSVAFSLTMAPSLLVANVASTLFLPVLSQVQKDRPQLERRYFGCAQVVALASALISIPLIVAGGPMVMLVYGKKYAAAAAFIGWLAAMQFLRTTRVAPTLAAMSLGDTENAMYSNIARTSAFLGILLVAALGGGMGSVAACGFFGELLALAVCVGRLRRRLKVPASLTLKPLMVTGIGLALAVAAAAAGVQSLHWPLAILAAGMVTLVVIIGMLFSFPELRQGLRAVLYRREQSAAI